jgi:hypothetical protein
MLVAAQQINEETQPRSKEKTKKKGQNNRKVKGQD